MIILMTPQTLPSFLNEKISVVPDGCWLWQGAINDSGYGLVTLNGRRTRVHRLVYETLVCKIPKHLVIDHLCRVRNCCNPEHLEPVTPQINTLRGNGPAARKASQTHCVNGHEFTPETTYIHKTRGTRNCRICMIQTARKRRAGLANTGVCVHKECQKTAVSKGLCTSHYMKMWRGKEYAASQA